MASLAYHPTHPGWRRLLSDVLAVDAEPGDPPALMGIHDEPELDEDVVVELAHRTQRRPS